MPKRRYGVVITIVALLAAGCSSGGDGDAPGDGGAGKAKDAGGGKDAAKVTVSPVDGTQKVAPDQPVTVTVADGKLTDVTLADAKGRKATGALAADGTSWKPKWTLRPGAAYTLTAHSTGKDGKQVTTTSSFTTLTPGRVLESGMAPLPGGTVGVGMPVQLLLSVPVNTKAGRTAVERSLEVTMSKPVEGAWSWVSAKEVQYRPRSYWPTGEKVKITAHLTGVKAGTGLYGTKDRTTDFTVGPRHITTVNARSHEAVVTSGGKVVRTIPVSLGKPGDDSYSGTMIAQEKTADMVMDSATTGNPGEYRTPTKWNVRMTYSGTFFHSAPWSTGAQGNANVSHGCLNASPANARWFYDFTNIGDVIVVKGTTRTLQFGNGPTPWAKTWQQWLASSATGAQTRG